MTDLLMQSANIVERAVAEYRPRVTVALVSGGDDSLTAFYVSQALNIPVDYIVHVDTRTGIPETRAFVEWWAQSINATMLVGDAGDAYEQYVMRKGFFGRGISAHAMAYHILKAGPLRKVISSIRQKRRDYPVMMLTGIRLDESDNRKYNFAAQTVKRDPAAPNNIFVNLIERWSKQDCKDLLSEVKAPRNPVAKALHRSGECMCGTMQDNEDRQLASILYPGWGKKLDTLEEKAVKKHGWGWCENMPNSIKQRRAGQMPFVMKDGFEMCRHCLFGQPQPTDEAPRG